MIVLLVIIAFILYVSVAHVVYEWRPFRYTDDNEVGAAFWPLVLPFLIGRSIGRGVAKLFGL